MSHLKSTPRLALIVTALCCVVLLASGCAKDKKTTAPAGVTGPTFSFTFPATGSSNKQTFTDVGVWGYKCIPHEAGGMVGAVKVIAGGPVDSAVVTVGPFGGFGYDPYFFLPALNKTAAELSAQEKNHISHRGQALMALAAKLTALQRSA